MKTEIKIAFLIPIILIASILLMSTSLWNYKSGSEFGSLLGFILFFATIVWSVIHVVIIMVKPQLNYKLIWLILTAIPIFYLFFMIISGRD
jgi:hypothetical protein